jgi:hypothetical protein
MIRKSIPVWTLGAALALTLGVGPVGCGGSDTDTADFGGSGNDDDDEDSSSGGRKASGGSKATGGKSNGTGAMGGDTASTGGRNGTGSGGKSSTEPAKIEDLIAAICEYEFNCCSEGELAYRLGSTGESVDECIKDFTFQLKESNAASNPFPTGTATGLLGILGYTVDLKRVEESPKGIAECIASWESRECRKLPSGEASFCEPGVGKNPCALTNLFKPALAEGDRCTLSLSENTTENDVECKAGTTCLPANDPDNPNDYPSCVRRGVAEEPCSADKDCDFNFYCNRSGDCTEKGDEGDDCSFKDPDAPSPMAVEADCKPGLKCSPETEKCVAQCKEDFPCSSNSECPEGLVCAPTTIGNDSVTWKTCQPIGKNANARCDEDADCEPNRYCDGNVCQADKSINDGCVRDEMCESGSFCDRATVNENGAVRTPSLACTAYFQAGATCFPVADASNGCASAASRCIYNPDDLEYQCSKNLRKANEPCNPDNGVPECQAGLKCEVVDSTADWPYACTKGASKGEACDDDLEDDEALSCGAGLICVNGKCAEQRGPGEGCEDPDYPGYPNDSLCLNSSCVRNWANTGIDWLCSDAPVPVDNAGSGLTCGG